MAVGSGRPNDFAFRPLRKPEEYRQAEAVQREALGPAGALAVPGALLRSLQDNGGLVLGAFADIYLAGVTAASIGWDGAKLYLDAHVVAVRPEYQSHRVGFRLLAFLREEVLRLGLTEVRGTIDPLHRPSASLALRRLGARADRLLVDYYGQLSEADGPRDESDRLHLRWVLDDPGVERRLAGALPEPAQELARLGRAAAIVETEPGESGLRLPVAVADPTGPEAHLEVPFDWATIREHEGASVRRWRHAVRDAFRAALDAGYVVDDFVAVSLEHERRCFYLLRAAAAEGPAAPSP